jgi:hypothetical protein
MLHTAAKDRGAQVAGGFRQPLPASWPVALQDIIASCWQQDQSLRPTMTEVIPRLRGLIASGELDTWEHGQHGLGGRGGCDCCSIM